MNVRPVRNINDSDLSTREASFAHPEDVPTDVSFLIQRARLSEVCRQALDARPVGAPEEDVTDCNRVLSLDHAFEKALAELPPFFRPRAPIPKGAPRCLRLQRDTILLAVHSRRARINRPFILKDNPNETQRLFRSSCLSSARMAVSIAIDMLTVPGLKATSQDSFASSSLARRMTTTIGHLFGACAILALNAARVSGAIDEDVDLKNACGVLTVVGEESPVAASLVQTLTAFLRRHQIGGIVGSATPEPTPARTTAASISGNAALGPNDWETTAGACGFALDHVWNEFIDSAPSADSWDELFAGLDECFGPS